MNNSSAAFVSTLLGFLVYQKHKTSCCQSKSSCCPSSQASESSPEPTISNLDLPVIEIAKLKEKDIDPEGFARECDKLANALYLYGCALVRDPDFQEEENQRFLNMMESYFEISDGKRDARPEIGYQVGVTPEKVEVARDYSSIMRTYSGNNVPISPIAVKPDNKWRYFWRMNPPPAESRFNTSNSVNAQNIVPPEFPQWTETMNTWGRRMINAQFAIAQMLGFGLHLPNTNAIFELIQNGPHLLAPTGSDLLKYGKKGDVLASFHSDLNYITIHGKSRYPGLFVWLRNGTKVAVKVPDGCLLIQAGKQLEYITGGHILAGYHEVVVTDATLNAINERKKKGCSTWRVSSTLFAHVESDKYLEPLPGYDTTENKLKYPKIYAGDFVANELQLIKLSK